MNQPDRLRTTMRMQLELLNAPAMEAIRAYSELLITKPDCINAQQCIGEHIPGFISLYNGQLYLSIHTNSGRILTNDPRLQPYFDKDDSSIRIDELAVDFRHPHMFIHSAVRSLLYAATLEYAGEGYEYALRVMETGQPYGWPTLEHSEIFNTILTGIRASLYHEDTPLSGIQTLTLNPNLSYAVGVFLHENTSMQALFIASDWANIEITEDGHVYVQTHDESDKRVVKISLNDNQEITDVMTSNLLDHREYCELLGAVGITHIQVYEISSNEAGFFESFAV